MTGNWIVYSWPPAIVLVSVMLIFLLDFGAERYVDKKYGLHNQQNVEGLITNQDGAVASGMGLTHNQLHSGDQDDKMHAAIDAVQSHKGSSGETDIEKSSQNTDEKQEQSFRQQIAAFLILEFGVIFHSVIIGLNLGSVGPEFSVLFPVIVFHQCFEGLGIGARMSAIPFPKRLSWLPWALCTAYGLTTPIAIAIGLGLRTTYNADSFTANIVSGVLDATSAGILIYTGLVELLARDFLYNPELTRNSKRLTFMLVCLFVGAGLMALLGKWA